MRKAGAGCEKQVLVAKSRFLVAKSRCWLRKALAGLVAKEVTAFKIAAGFPTSEGKTLEPFYTRDTRIGVGQPSQALGTGLVSRGISTTVIWPAPWIRRAEASRPGGG